MEKVAVQYSVVSDYENAFLLAILRWEAEQMIELRCGRYRGVLGYDLMAGQV